jgi:hypothetical protein
MSKNAEWTTRFESFKKQETEAIRVELVFGLIYGRFELRGVNRITIMT